MKPPCSSNSNDYVEWRRSHDSNFSTKELICVYLAMIICIAVSCSRLFGGGMGLRELYTIYGRLPVVFWLQMLRVHRQMVQVDICPLCNSEPETVIHSVRVCIWAKNIWTMASVNDQYVFFQHDLVSLMMMNLKSQKLAEEVWWIIWFAATLDRIWWRRNSFVFNHL